MKFKEVVLGEVCEILDTLRKPITKKNREKGKYPYYGATGVIDYIDSYIFDETLVLIGEDGAKWDRGEQTSFIASGKYWVNNHAHVVKPHKDKLNKKFLMYYLNSLDLKPWVTGLTVPKLNQKKLKTIPIPLPNLKEQERIINKLEIAFTEINKQTETLKLKEKMYDNFFDSAFTAIFNKITSSEIMLGDVSNFIRGPFGGSLKKNIFVKKGYAVYEQKHAIRNSCKEFRYFINSEKFKEMKRFEVKKGDILMSCSGTIGKTTIVPDDAPEGIINQALLKITPSEKIDVQYLNFYMHSSLFKSQLMKHIDGAAIKNVASVKILKQIKIRLPSINVQKEVLLKLKSLLKEIQKAKELIVINKENYSILKSAILTKEIKSHEAA